MKKKKVLSVVLAATMVAGLAAGCGSSSDSGSKASSDAKGKVYYLNFKPQMNTGRNWLKLIQMRPACR